MYFSHERNLTTLPAKSRSFSLEQKHMTPKDTATARNETFHA